MEIIKKNAMDAWKAALKYILEEGKDFTDREQRVCRETLNMVLVVESPKTSVEEPINFMMRSENWVYPSKNELASIILEKKASNIYKYSYGPRIFDFNGKKDQIGSFIIPLLKKDPNSRRGTVVLYNPETDSETENKDIPGLGLIYFKIKEGKLNITCFIRSNDMFVGWPANVYQLYVLQEVVAEKLSLGIGSITTFSASAHVFEEHFNEISRVI